MNNTEKSKAYFKKLIEENELLKKKISVLAKPLSVEEAIGEPGRRDFPIIEGKERILEAVIDGSKGHTFTDSAKEFKGELHQIAKLPLANNHNRAIYIATLNSVMRYLGILDGTVHCKNDEPEKCAKDISEKLYEKHGKVKIGLIGLNPAIAEEMIYRFGNQNVIISDLYKNNIQNGEINVLDGKTSTKYLVQNSDVIVLTGTTFVNDTFDAIFEVIQKAGKIFYVYGVTSAALCKIFNFERLCPYGSNE